DVIAEYDCNWSDSELKCQQHGEPASTTRASVIREMRRLGLPPEADANTYFTVWKPISAEWSVAEGYYSRVHGDRLDVCEVVLLLRASSPAVVLRKLRFQQTDADVPAVTTWSPLGLVDVDADGQIDIVLAADAYEDHWLEVITPHPQSSQTIFSGL